MNSEIALLKVGEYFWHSDYCWTMTQSIAAIACSQADVSGVLTVSLRVSLCPQFPQEQ